MDTRAVRCSSWRLEGYYYSSSLKLTLSPFKQEALSTLAFWLLVLMLLIMIKQSEVLSIFDELIVPRAVARSIRARCRSV